MEQPARISIDFQTPLDHTALMQAILQAEQRYPFVNFSYLGSTLLDRGIPLIRLGNSKRAILYVGAHHGMEWITASILIKFLFDLCESYTSDRRIGSLSVKQLVESHTIYLIPMLNPDGVEYQIHGIYADNPLYERLLVMNDHSTDFSHWQANARGVDLNHNYDAGFAEYKRLEAEHGIADGAPTRYSGTAPESELEVLALCNFIRYHSELLGVMTLHTQGEEILYRSGSITLPRTERIAQRLSQLSGYRLSDADGLASFGGLTDWCIQERALPSFTIECGKGINPLPATDLSSIYSVLRRMLFFFPTLL